MQLLADTSHRKTAMIDTVENLILEHLRAIRADAAFIKEDTRQLMARMASMESQMVQMHKGMTLIHEDVAAINLRMDQFSQRIQY